MLFDFGFISLRWVWVVLTIVFALIEVFTLGLTTVWFALSALVMVFLSFLNIPLPAQILIFLGIAAILLVFTRPLALRKFKTGTEKTNVDSLIGKHALVTKGISEFEKGEVKLNGQIWSARSEDNTEIREGTKCEVIRIEGVQAIIRSLPDTIIEN
ncbi:MAG: NfeD family protein [Treponema sp.]|jgi:membrane protein implicated in regulation of membrane protease activity|nr:NfeD family protein [Treponema sp.]